MAAALLLAHSHPAAPPNFRWSLVNPHPHLQPMLHHTDRNDISVGIRALALIIIAIPVNIIMTLISAFTGEDEARQSRARPIVIGLLIVAAALTLAVVATRPDLLDHL